MPGAYSSLVLSETDKRLVEGFANVSVLDRQGDVVPVEAMSQAMLNYMDKGGIILLSHENKPVGKVVQWNVQKPEGSSGDGIHIIAQIYTDSALGDAAWKMLKEKMITGFSIGGVAREVKEIRDKGAVGGVARELTKIELNEISLVQIPANQEAIVETLSVAKSGSVRKELHRHGSTRAEADSIAQKLKQEGAVVYRVVERDGEWAVDYGFATNVSNSQGAREQQRAPEKKPSRSTLDAYKAQKGKARVPLALAEDAPTRANPETIEAEQDGNYDSSVYGVQNIQNGCSCGHDVDKHECSNCECKSVSFRTKKDGAIVGSSLAGVENARYGPEDVSTEPNGKKYHGEEGGGGVHEKAVPVEKPFQSRAQQRFMHAKHPDIARRWDKITDFSNLPEHKRLEGRADGSVDEVECGMEKGKGGNLIGECPYCGGGLYAGTDNVMASELPFKCIKCGRVGSISKGDDDPRPEKVEGSSKPRGEAENQSELVSGEEAFDRTDTQAAGEYEGSGELADERVQVMNLPDKSLHTDGECSTCDEMHKDEVDALMPESLRGDRAEREAAERREAGKRHFGGKKYIEDEDENEDRAHAERKHGTTQKSGAHEYVCNQCEARRNLVEQPDGTYLCPTHSNKKMQKEPEDGPSRNSNVGLDSGLARETNLQSGLVKRVRFLQALAKIGTCSSCGIPGKTTADANGERICSDCAAKKSISRKRVVKLLWGISKLGEESHDMHLMRQKPKDGCSLCEEDFEE